MIDKSIKGKAIPRVLFFEREDVVENLCGSALKKRETRTSSNQKYYSKESMLRNNFWTTAAD